MTVSSRTPEGFPNNCPVCRSAVRVEVSCTVGDATCPHCGTLLWFVEVEWNTILTRQPELSNVREAIRRLLTRFAEQRPANSESLFRLVERLNGSRMDSLELVELVMDCETDFSDDQTSS